MTVAVAAIFISVVSLAVAILHGRTMERMAEENARLVAANSWPFLQYGAGTVTTDGVTRVKMGVFNAGIGPAKIESAELMWKGVAYRGDREFLEACCGFDPAKGTPFDSDLVPGMVLRADVAANAIDSVPANGRPILYPSPRGAPLTQRMVREWSAGPGLILFCGRFEGLDERVIEARDMREICVGDAVLAGGEAAALVIVEACVRLIPGVLGNEASPQDESFENGLLEHPHYTRPREWEGRAIPEVLLGGDHAKIEKWKQAERERITKLRRPDLKR